MSINFSGIGSISLYTNANNFTSQSTTKTNDNITTKATQKEKDKSFYQNFANDYAKNQKENEELKALSNKLKNGEKLSKQEEKYLKSENPELYKESEETAKECKAYKKSIENAETKNDVENIKLNTIMNFSSELKSVENNPHIPDNKKLEVAERINEKLSLISQEHNKFVNTDDYEKLSDNDDNNSASEKINVEENLLKEQINNVKLGMKKDNHIDYKV